MEHLLPLGWNAQLQSQSSLPEASNLISARVVAVDRDSVLVASSLQDLSNPCRVSLAGRLRHNGCEEIAVGDWVGLHETRIDYLYKRQSVFVRKRAGNSSREQPIAANVDWTLVTMSLNEDFSRGRAERFILAAWDAGTTPLIVLTKADLVTDASPAIDALADVSAGCELFVVSSTQGDGIEALKARLGAGQTAVLVGSSGVGKSSLINALVGEETLATAPIREADAKGRHTTTRRELVLLPETGALLIDTPGMREFAVISSEDGEGIEQSFSDIEALTSECGFRDCAHNTEPDCAILASIEEGELSSDRLRSYQKLLRELAYNDSRKDAGKMREEKLRWKKLTTAYRQRGKFNPKN